MPTVTGQVNVAFVEATSEGESVQADFVSAVRGVSSILADVVDVQSAYVGMRWPLEESTVTVLVPWSNIKSLSQVV